MEKKIWIKDFLTHLEARSDVGEGRKKKYRTQLKYISEWCPCDFEKATRKDIEKLVARVNTARVKRVIKDKSSPDGCLIVEGKEFSDNTKCDYYNTIKTFWKWLRNAEAGEEKYEVGTSEYPLEVKWIKRKGLRLKSAVASKDEFLTDKEFERLMRQAPDSRYRALWAVLREKGPRITELLTCKIHDFKMLDEDTATLMVAQNIRGKTEYSRRTIGLTTKSIPFITQWLNEHPEGTNPDAWLFPGQTGHLTGSAALVTLKRAAKRAKIRKRVFHHLFRHESITRSRGELNIGDGSVRAEHGLSPTSKVLANYSKLTDDDANRAYFEATGFWKPGVKKVDKTKGKNCPWCGDRNPFTNEYCAKCAKPLDPSTIQEYIVENKVARLCVAWMDKEQPGLFDKFTEFYMEQVRSGAKG